MQQHHGPIFLFSYGEMIFLHAISRQRGNQESDMGLVTEDLTEFLTASTQQTQEQVAENPFKTGIFALARAPGDSGWHHAVHRVRKWLRTTLAAHGEHGDGLTR